MSNYGAFSFELQYTNLLHYILSVGVFRQTRTGIVRALFNKTLEIELINGYFPILTGRKMFWKNIMGEAEWMLSGSTNVKDLHLYDVHIWDQWADENGELGATYGEQLHAQWKPTMRLLAQHPLTRRAVISLWHPELSKDLSIPPCYHSLQFYSEMEGLLLSLKVEFRSSDAAVGLPYDAAVLAYLLIKASDTLGIMPHKLVLSLTDVHINEENFLPVQEYLRTERFMAPRYVVCNNRISLRPYNQGEHIQMTVKP